VLTSFPSITFNQPHLTILHDAAPDAVLVTILRVLRAYDPHGVLPPAGISYLGFASTPIDSLAFTELATTLASRDLYERKEAFAFAGIEVNKDKDPAEPLTGGLQIAQAAVRIAQWLTVAAKAVTPRGSLFNPPGTGPGAIAPRAEHPTSFVQRYDSVAPVSKVPEVMGGWPTAGESLETLLRQCIMWLAYEKILKDPYYSTGDIEAPQGSPKEAYARIERATRLLSLVATLQLMLDAMPLREQARLILSPFGQEYMRFAKTEVNEEVSARARELLAFPVHPWLAEAERLLLPSKRYTQWAPSSDTLGFSRSGLWAMLKREATAKRSTGGGSSTPDMREFITGDIAESFRVAATRFSWTAAAIGQDRINAAAGLLGGMQPSSAAQLQLHGQDVKIVASTGASSNAAFGSLADLLCTPRVAYASPSQPTFLAGPVATFAYDAEYWATGTEPTSRRFADRNSLLKRPPAPPLYVVPHRPEFDPSFTLQQLSPRVLQPVADGSWFGDEDAIYARYSLEGVAQLLGYNGEDDLMARPDLMKELSHLFEKTASGYTPLPALEAAKVHSIFLSNRTRRTWVKAVPLPTTAGPQAVAAVDIRTAFKESRIEAVIARTPEVAPLTVADAGISEQIVKLATGWAGL